MSDTKTQHCCDGRHCCTDQSCRVTITKGEYQRFLDDSRFLAMLQNYGVDNWEGWDDCVQAFDGGTV